MKKYVFALLAAVLAVWAFSFINFTHEFQIFVRTDAPENTPIQFEYKTPNGAFIKAAKINKNHQAFLQINESEILAFKATIEGDIKVSSVYFHGDKSYDIPTKNGVWKEETIHAKVNYYSLFSDSFFWLLVFLFVISLFKNQGDLLEKRPKFMNIEFLRIVFTLAVVYCHFVFRMGIWQAAWLSVEFFFILSGFLLVMHFNPSQSVLTFIKKKIIRFWPLIAAMTILRFRGGIPLSDVLSDILFLPTPSLHLRVGIVDYAWYITLLLWVSAFYFYLMKTQRRETLNSIFAVICFFCYVGLTQYGWGRTDRLGESGDIGFIFSAYVLRAVADIGMGYFLAQLYKSVNVQPVKHKIAYSLLEGAVLFYSIFALFFEKLFLSNIYMVISFFVLLWMFIQKRGYVSQFFEKPIWSKMSKYCLSIYLMQGFTVSVLFPRFFNNYSVWMLDHKAITCSVTLVVAIIFGIIGYYLIEKPAAMYLKKILFDKQSGEGQ